MVGRGAQHSRNGIFGGRNLASPLSTHPDRESAGLPGRASRPVFVEVYLSELANRNFVSLIRALSTKA